MSQSLAKVALHLVFSTKGRRPWLGETNLREQLYAYMATVLRNQVDSPAITIGGAEDHVHVLCNLSRKYPIMELVKVVKTETTKWLKKQSDSLQVFEWQAGYGVFSVSESNITTVKKYIQNQEEHHRKMSFQDEFRQLCQRHGVDLDERYAWD